MDAEQQTVEDSLQAGHEALAAGDWSRAREHFEAVLVGEESAVALEGLGWAAWWLADEQATFDARERAFRVHRTAGAAGAAARLAAWIASDYREYRAEGSIGQGWLLRAHSLLEGLPESADHGWVQLIDADFALNLDADCARAERLSLEVVGLGRRLGVADLEAVGLAQGGIAMVLQGRIEEGMRLLDEATVIAASEELEYPISQGWSLCCLISACEGVGDFPRAAQWCGRMREFSDRWGGRQIAGICRTAYGRVLATSGDWPGAEVELLAAVSDLQAARPGLAGGGLTRLGELRARQGRTDEARALFEQAGPRGLIGLGQLALGAGDPAAAADTAERVLRAIPVDVVLERLPALELLARARAQLGDVDAATAAREQLEATVAALETPYLRGRTKHVAGEVAAAAGDHERARRDCEDAVDCFTASAAPYDAALARLELARALTALGHGDRATAELVAARETFATLGAQRDLGHANELHAAAERVGEEASAHVGGERPADTAVGAPAAALSARELDVLRLVAQGLGDAEIAERLVLSPHTVHRHVANVRTKLRLPSRSAAVAYAARHGLL